ncbi:MAG TPA: carbohydrate binding domain-containing protein, partial [Acidothermaceae bacterium]|nr:carbohydrate binding domain-containing protein [Acidothermaceae bacterium]
MRKLRSALAAAAAASTAVAGVALVMASAATAATNVVANPGFEAGNLSGWSCSAADSAVTGHAHSGSYALQGAASNSDVAQCSQSVAVSPSTAYSLSAYVNGAYVYLGV